MSKFMDDNFLLRNELSKRLFHEVAKDLPIIDYHSHLEPKDIYENTQYRNLTQVWLFDKGLGDHYKWRLMRANGEPESCITGEADDREKFDAFVRTLENAPGNPIYEWSHLELRRYFGIDLTINLSNADEIWRQANNKLSELTARELIKRSNVVALCTTDDPTSDLVYHQLLAKEEPAFKVLPTFRPDAVWAIDKPGYSDYLAKLGAPTSFDALKSALSARVRYFDSVGGKMADHGLNRYEFASASSDELDSIFDRAVRGLTDFTALEIAQFTTALNLHLMQEYVKRDWTLQMHVNAFRDDSTRLRQIGVNIGGDSMGDQAEPVRALTALFDAADSSDSLPKTLVFSLNPNDWLPLTTMLQVFQGGSRQKLQLGNAWWFNDTLDGMRLQLTTMAQQSLLSNITGMLTDSRSFLSYTRHEYFRRILCQLLSEWALDGRLPQDFDYLSNIVRRISYQNAHDDFGFFDKGVLHG